MKTEEDTEYRPIKAPMTDMEFRNYLDSDGHMVKPGEFRLSIYQGGTEAALRRVVWRHLLNIYPESMSGRERFAYMKKKENEYFELRDHWKKLQNTQQLSEEVKHVLSLVRKDVLRTDRTHKYYAGGDESKNLVALFNLLVTYALTHPEVSYCQGMSDIASPLLVVQKEEAQAYLCFCGLMKRLRTNFLYDGEAITTKLQHLSMLVNFYDPDFHAYMKNHGADDLFFCYRWLLLEMKREFPFDDALYMLEVMWSTLPPCPPETELALKDDNYCQTWLVSVSPNSPSFALKTQYAHLLAKRRLSSVVKDVPVSKSPRDTSVCHLRASPKVDNSACNSDCSAVDEVSADNGDFAPIDGTNKAVSATVSTDCGSTDNSELSVNKDKINHENSILETNEDKLTGSTGTENVNDCSGDENKKCAVQKQKSDSSAKTENGSSNDNSDYISAPVSVGTISPSNSVLTNSSSYMSSSQSAERFPSLISASIDEETEVLSLNGDFRGNENMNTNLKDGSNDLSSELPHGDSADSDIDRKLRVCSDESIVNGEDENDNHSQFYMSLEETEHVPPKPDIPQIKGSFFSGMRRLLMSPEKRNGKAQKVLATSGKGTNGRGRRGSNGTKSSAPGSAVSNSENLDKCDSEAGIDDDAEHTLFEVNRMMRSLNMDSVSSADSDSGNGSFNSLLNSGNAQNGKHRSNSQGNGHKMASKSIDILSNEQKRYFDQKYAEVMEEVPTPERMLDGKQPSFCDNHFALDDGLDTGRSEDAKEASEKEDGISDCMEAIASEEMEISRYKQLPAPEDFGYGNPFLMFACLTVLLQHRDIIMKTGMEYDELAMYFDKMVRKHNVNKVLHQARVLYTEYIRMQQRIQSENVKEEDVKFSI